MGPEGRDCVERAAHSSEASEHQPEPLKAVRSEAVFVIGLNYVVYKYAMQVLNSETAERQRL